MIGAAALSSPKKRFADINVVTASHSFRFLLHLRISFYISIDISRSTYTTNNIHVFLDVNAFYLSSSSLSILFPFFFFASLFFSVFQVLRLEPKFFDDGFDTVFARLIRTDGIVEPPRELSTSLTIT